MSVTGLLLAAGAGRRAGGPKALRHDPDGTSWLQRSADVLLTGGCSDVLVVLGCEAAEARRLLASDRARVRAVEAPDWADGMGASLRTGLAAVDPAADAVLVHLVDLPDVTSAVVRRVLAEALGGSHVLARATYGGRPGHPVLLGAAHLPPLLTELEGMAESSGDVGARAYLARHDVRSVECADLASGSDMDTQH